MFSVTCRSLGYEAYSTYTSNEVLASDKLNLIIMDFIVIFFIMYTSVAEERIVIDIIGTNLKHYPNVDWFWERVQIS